MAEVEVGASISFGGRPWCVLDRQGDAALLVTEKIIEQRPYHDAYKEITWADCALRAYLNGAFYEGFSAADRARIVPVVNSNLDNHWYGTKGGAATEDRVFLLSMEEVVCRYFGDSSAKLNNPGKKQRYWFERKDANNSKRTAWLEAGGIWWWWLRSPGRVGVKAVYVHGDGNIGIQGNNILKGNLADGRCTGGVRPALWLRLG
jgi:hypothetical protein